MPIRHKSQSVSTKRPRAANHAHRVTVGKNAVIAVHDLGKVFGKGETAANALNGISLEIQAGEYVILFGPSGCGKSTLLHSIAGLEPISAGEVKIRGQSLQNLTKDQLALHRRTKVGMVFQQFNILKSMTVLQNVALPQLFAGVPGKIRTRRALHLLRILNLEKFASRIPTELSGGQQQRVAIARALVNNPWILLFDEPTGILDSKAADEVMQLITNLNIRSKRTVLMVTHNPEHLKYADRVLFMRDGQIVKETHQKKVIIHDRKLDMDGLEQLAEDHEKNT